MEELNEGDRALMLESLREARRRMAVEIEAACRITPANAYPSMFGAGYISAMGEVELLLTGIRPTGPRWD
jgi:hypothetical protein